MKDRSKHVSVALYSLVFASFSRNWRKILPPTMQRPIAKSGQKVNCQREREREGEGEGEGEREKKEREREMCLRL